MPVQSLHPMCNSRRNSRRPLLQSKRGLAGALCAALVSLALHAESVQVGATAPDFAIKDQYDQEFRLSTHHNQPVLLIYGDRLGSDYMGVWARAVVKAGQGDTVEVVRVANLHSVPPFFHGFVKRQFQGKNSEGKPGAPVLLDWDGELAGMLGFTDDLTNVYLLDTHGYLCYRASGKGTDDETQKLLAAIGNLHKQNEQPTKGTTK